MVSDSGASTLQKALLFASLFVAWEVVYRYGGWPGYLLPGPMQVLAGIWDGVASGTLVQAVATSLRRIAIAFAVAVACGVLLGVIMAESRLLGDLLHPFLAGMQSLPSICWFPLAILWLGLSERSVYAVTILGALFAIATAVTSGLRQIPPAFLDAAATMGAKGFDRVRWVLLPALLPTLVGGMRQGWSFAWRSLMAAELLFHNGGVGYMLMRARELNDVAQVMCVILVILVLGALVERLLFDRMERHLRNIWGLSGNRA